MSITRYIQRFCLTHLDHLGKVLHLCLGLLHWTMQWQMFLGKCWTTGNYGGSNHGVHLYRSQASPPIDDWHVAFLQAAKRTTFFKSRASLCLSTLIWPQRVVRCCCRHSRQCLHSWCVDAKYCATYHLNIFPITLPDSKESKTLRESQRDSLGFLRLDRYMFLACTCPILSRFVVIPMLCK